MKKIILSVAAVLAISFTNAQEKKTSGNSDIKFGIKGSYINANYGADADDGDARSGFYLGGLIDFSVSEKFHIQPELLYTMEGSAETDTDLNFLRIPVMAKIYADKGFSVQAGPQFGFVAGGGEIKRYLKSMDIGLGFGGAYELPTGLFFDARYNVGLTDLNDFPAGSGVEGFKITQNSFHIGLGYRF